MEINSLMEVFLHSLMITSFVFIVMLLIEYINFQTQGIWQEVLKNNNFSQYFIAAFLGAAFGCFGVFSVVALFSYSMVSFGALVTAILVTSGDESLLRFHYSSTWMNKILFPKK